MLIRRNAAFMGKNLISIPENCFYSFWIETVNQKKHSFGQASSLFHLIIQFELIKVLFKIVVNCTFFIVLGVIIISMSI